MSYSVGTPEFQVFGIFDTGSDIIWPQCQPCKTCYDQTTAIFNSSPTKPFLVLLVHVNQCITLVLLLKRKVVNIVLAMRMISSGIVGLGSGPVSLISQLSSSMGGRLSYCFASVDDIPSKLSFGDAAVVTRGTVSTPIGTTLTLLPGDVYSKLESALAKEIELDRVEDPFNQLSLCDKGKFHELHAPVITAHFRCDADVKLNVDKSFIDAGDGVVCFAFMASETFSIFGNIAQKNLLVGYDLQKKTVSFKPTDCTKQ
ncbi:hypothetical protein VNO80_19415 [Phaseolus coccineus]|uniref:Peptidase A1 domain-containing protein n=1 Tax=Phaseolus coccineus TaxID=3886 RepID=A0AAN9R0M1_PHACN